METKELMKKAARKLVVIHQFSAEAYYTINLNFARELFTDNISEFEEILKEEFEKIGIK